MPPLSTAGSPSTGSGLTACSLYGTQIYTDIYKGNCGFGKGARQFGSLASGVIRSLRSAGIGHRAESMEHGVTFKVKSLKILLRLIKKLGTLKLKL